MKDCGENLMFLISQPRTGSTLLQRVLGNHQQIHTISEPWLMLHPLYALRSEGYKAEYDAYLASGALKNFLHTIPGGKEVYIEGLRRMYTSLYERAFADLGKCYFLDKTPRYYFIIPDLYRLFPKAKFIFLLRNPLAVLCSILNTWIKGEWLYLYRFKHDLIRAPRLLLEGIKILGRKSIVVQYEKLVNNPENEIRKICKRLKVKFTPEMIDYGRHNLPLWHFGDQDGVYKHNRPVSQNVDKWVQALDNAQIWRLVSDYLQLLGKETIEQLGYSYEELCMVLETHRPHRIRLISTFPLAWLLKKPVNERKMWERGIVWLITSLRQRGVGGTMVATVRKIIYAFSNPK